MIKGIRTGNIILDCADAKAMQTFYAQMLGWEKGVLYDLPMVKNAAGEMYLFAQEEDYVPPVWPEEEGKQQKQMHIDYQVPDLAAAVVQAEQLGARKTASQYGGDEFVTFVDPAGHPFCLCAESNIG